MNDMYSTIDELCKERGIKPGKMCSDLGISRGNITDLKMGRIETLSATSLSKIADYFGVTIDHLIGGTQKEKTPTSQGERELPHAKYREILSQGGIRIMLDTDANVPQEHLDDIIEFIKFKQRKNGR